MPIDDARFRGGEEAEQVIAPKAADGKLLHQRHAIGVTRIAEIAPLCLGDLAVENRHQLRPVAGCAGDRVALLRQFDRIVGCGAHHHQNVGGGVVGHVAAGLVAIVAIEDANAGGGILGPHVEDELVDPAAAVELVGASLSLQPVAIGPAEERVVAGVAIELVLAGAAIDCVGASPGDAGGEDQILGILLADRAISLDRVVAAIAIDRVGADAAIDPVAPGATMDLLADEFALAGDVGVWIEREAVRQHGAERAIRPAIDLIDSLAAEEPLAGKRSEEPLAVAGGIGGCGGGDSGVAEEGVVASISKELIEPGSSLEDVVVGTAADDVVP